MRLHDVLCSINASSNVSAASSLTCKHPPSPPARKTVLPLHHILQPPLQIPPYHILLHPTDGPTQHRAQHTRPRRQELPRKHQRGQYPELAHEFHKLIDLIQIVLGADEVPGRGVVFLLDEAEDGDEGGARAVVGDEPDCEELVDGDVEG